MKTIKFILTITFLLFLSSYLIADIYPAPYNLSASDGNSDNITVRWQPPTPPEFGEGFETNKIPPTNWETIINDSSNTWQIMSNPNYVKNGSYSACVPYTYSDGEILGLDNNIVKNGSFNAWANNTPEFWDSHNVNIHDTLSIEDSILIISDANFEFVSQTIEVSNFSKYKLEFISKQDSLVSSSKYAIKIWDLTNKKYLFSKNDLSNYTFTQYSYDFYTAKTDSLELRLYASDSEDSINTYWNDIILKKYDIEPKQDEWLITEEYEVKSNTELIFDLGTSQIYGTRSPVFVLISKDNGNNWNDLLVCDGFQNIPEDSLDSFWEWNEYSDSLNQYINETVKFAFRYLGGNGELVCLDNVRIGETKADVKDFFVVPPDHPLKLQSIESRAGISKQNNRSPVLTGYKLYKELYPEGNSDRDTTFNLDNDTLYIDIDVNVDSAYIYEARAVYDNLVPSTNSSAQDLGYIEDTNSPTKPMNNNANFSFTMVGGVTPEYRVSYKWRDPYEDHDITKYNIYNNGNLLATVNFSKNASSYVKTFQTNKTGPYQLTNQVYNLTMRSVDFNGNLSEETNNIQIAPPPEIKTSETKSEYNPITINKWDDSPCTLNDSIKLYRSISDAIDSFTLIEEFSQQSDSIYFTDNGKIEYPDTVSTEFSYYYYTTIEYEDSITSDISYINNAAETEIDVQNISNLELEIINDTTYKFTWEEPNCSPAQYSGVYCYLGSDITGTIKDTVYRDTTSYIYYESTPRIKDFTLIPFDKWGSVYYDDNGNLVKETIETIFFNLNYIPICYDTSKVIEDFESGIDTLWNQINEGDANGAIWHADDSGDSQWFEPTSNDGAYGWINDDIIGNNINTNCYLAIPSINGLNEEDKVYLVFDSFFDDEYNGKANIAINTSGSWKDIYSLTEDNEDFESETWETYYLNISSKVEDAHIDSFRLAFHFDDNDTWNSGWAIDNVSLLSSSSKPKILVKRTIDQNNQFFNSKVYPNPSNNNIYISYYLKDTAPVSIEIYNILGQKVTTVCKNTLKYPGINTDKWNGVDKNGNEVGTGVYFYRLKIRDKNKTRKFMIVK